MRNLSDEKNLVKLCHTSNALEFDIYLSEKGHFLFVKTLNSKNEIYATYTDVKAFTNYIGQRGNQHTKVKWFVEGFE